LLLDTCHRIVKIQLARDGAFGLSIGGEADERVARANVEVDIGQWFNVLKAVDLGDQLEKEAQLADFDGLFHDIDAVQVVDDDGFKDEVAAIWVLCYLRQDVTEARNVAAGTYCRMLRTE